MLDMAKLSLAGNSGLWPDHAGLLISPSSCKVVVVVVAVAVAVVTGCGRITENELGPSLLESSGEGDLNSS